MKIAIEVNGRMLKCNTGDYLLDVLNQYGLRVPTLCSMKAFSPTGACRLCVVEVAGLEDLVPACSYPINEFVSVKTHSARVIQARRTIVELLISSHPDDCLYCVQSNHCELQKLATELQVTERMPSASRLKLKPDRSSAALIHDPAKCVLCGRCIRTCDHMEVSALEFVGRGADMHVGTSRNQGLNSSTCISCGQCILNCPTGSLQEKSLIDAMIRQLHAEQQEVIALIDPAVTVSIGSALGFRSGKDLSGYIFAGLRKIGFSKVYSASEANDLSLFHAGELWTKRDHKNPGPKLLSPCPAWLAYISKLKPELKELVLPVLSPAQLFGRALKSKHKSAYLVYFTACTASKQESHQLQHQKEGVPVINAVLSTNELIQLIRIFGIDLEMVDAELADRLLPPVEMSQLLPAVSGGYLESMYRCLSIIQPEVYPQHIRNTKLRGSKPVKTFVSEIEGNDMKWISCSDIPQAIRLIKILSDEGGNALIEVMVCPGGCLNGGGQLGVLTDQQFKSRTKEIYDKDVPQSSQLNELADQAQKVLRKLGSASKLSFE